MIVLGIDTSGRQGSIALLRAHDAQKAGAAHGPVTVELVLLGEGRASELLVPAIDALLARQGLGKRSLSLIAIASGPGSFTGLRVAVATAKGLAEAFAVPVVPVSVLEAVALTSGVRGRAWAVMDAQRGELFFGDYVVEAGVALREREGIAAVDHFISDIASASPRLIVTPDSALRSRLPEASAELAMEVSEVRLPNAEDIARIAHRKFLAGERADVATLDANYLRRSDAEIVADRKPPA